MTLFVNYAYTFHKNTIHTQFCTKSLTYDNIYRPKLLLFLAKTIFPLVSNDPPLKCEHLPLSPSIIQTTVQMRRKKLRKNHNWQTYIFMIKATQARIAKLVFCLPVLGIIRFTGDLQFNSRAMG